MVLAPADRKPRSRDGADHRRSDAALALPVIERDRDEAALRRRKRSDPAAHRTMFTPTAVTPPHSGARFAARNKAIVSIWFGPAFAVAA